MSEHLVAVSGVGFSGVGVPARLRFSGVGIPARLLPTSHHTGYKNPQAARRRAFRDPAFG